MSDIQNNGEIIAHLPGGIEVRTAHGADGKFTSGSGGGSGIDHKKAARHALDAAKAKHPLSKVAHEASAKAWKSGAQADHKAALHAHDAAAGTTKGSTYSKHMKHWEEHHDLGGGW